MASMFARGAFVAAAAVAAASLLAHAGRFAWRLDVFSHLAPAYVALGLLLLISGLVRRRLGVAVWAPSLAAILAGSLLMAPEFTRSTGSSAAPGALDELKLVHLKTTDDANLDRLDSWLLGEAPDVIVVTGARRSLRDRLLGRGWRVAGAGGSLMIFTRERYLRMVRPKTSDPIWFVNATYAAAPGEIELVAAHLGWPTDPVVERQIRGLRHVIDERPGRRLILIGDLNATPWSARLRGLDQDLGLIRRDRAVPTWPARMLGLTWPAPLLPLDHVYAGEGWATVHVTRGPALGLDHYPLVVILAPARD